MEKKRHYTQKQKFDILESRKEIGIKEAADLGGVHYTTIYEWQRKLEVLGEEAFLAYKKKSVGRGIKKVTEEQEKAVRETWDRYPGFGPSQVRNQLRRQGVTISTKTVQKIMEANGYRGIRKKRDKEASQRFEANRPLELVQIDVLEFFIHKLKVYLLLIIDDFSRFILGFRLSTKTSVDMVIGLFQEAIDRYGKMEEVLSDRGFVFYSWRGINRFEQYLELEGIHQTHASPHHPQTLGKVEAVNKQIQKELIRCQEFKGVGDAEEAIKEWIMIHNYKRTHQGLGGLLVPADRFHGRVEVVFEALSKKIDPETQIGYDGMDISRSLLNLVLEPEGRVKFYVLGHFVDLSWRQP
ncbi:MAG: DDE-type integrase/transposase/recombinase [Deltaproteobacteria bacterium]|nr:DDE-type integrase/transposase/recombinase [Deltaproteobacteria bacterium]